MSVSPTFFLFLLLSSFAKTALPRNNPPPILLIGMDNQNKPLRLTVDRQTYRRNLATLLSSSQETVVPVLNRQTHKKRWRLQTFILGIGADLELGFKKILAIEIEPSISLVFTRPPQPTSKLDSLSPQVGAEEK